MDDLKLIVTPAPHFKSGDTTRSVMLDVCVALIPAFIAGVVFFGLQALKVMILCVLFCVLIEKISTKMMGRKCSIGNFSAVVTGLLLAMCLPAHLPWWACLVGSFLAIYIAKEIFGGIGFNIYNPAHIGRAFLLSSWPVLMTVFKAPVKDFGARFLSMTDTVTTATPLSIVKEAGNFAEGMKNLAASKITLSDMFIGKIAGSIGETSVIALVLGGAFLLYRGHITWHIPLSFIGTVFGLAFLFGGSHYFDLTAGMFHLCAGGLMIGAFFMATDMVTSPVSQKGRLLFGIGCGVLTFLIRKYGAYPEGVCYSILIMNSVVPLLDRYVKRKKYGKVVEGGQTA